MEYISNNYSSYYFGSCEFKSLPVVVLRDMVILPNFTDIPLYLGRDFSIAGAQKAFSQDDQLIALVTQVNPLIDEADLSNLYSVAAIAKINEIHELENGAFKILVDPFARGRLVRFEFDKKILMAEVTVMREFTQSIEELNEVYSEVLKKFKEYISEFKIGGDVLNFIFSENDPLVFSDRAIELLSLSFEEKQIFLETTNVVMRLEKILFILETKLSIKGIDKKIQATMKEQMEKSQKEYYLNEQIKAINKELGGGQAELDAEFQEIKRKIDLIKFSDEAREKIESKLKKLKTSNGFSAESTILRSYIDWLIDIPWNEFNVVNHDLLAAEKILNRDHFGLKKIKERILEYLAVSSRVEKLPPQIICFVGPPGVGKTSLGKSIAEATGRAFVRASLGGVSDEAEIRGHRSTYIGAMPGKIIQGMKKIKSSNPLFLLDEIDKMGRDWRGDPSAALLEVLDPEQNSKFNDNYIEVDYDLSSVMFIATANSLNIPKPLLDRMEIIKIDGYTENEKFEIAKRHLIKKQMELHGVKNNELKILDSSIYDLIKYYTRESGVRNLEREIALICRKFVKKSLENKGLENESLENKDLKNKSLENEGLENESLENEGLENESLENKGLENKFLENKDLKNESLKNKENFSFLISSENLKDFCGIKKYSHTVSEIYSDYGVSTGLAWTETGGDILFIEVLVIPGNGQIIHTGQLGDVMKESIQAAYSYVKSRASDWQIDDSFFEKHNIHIHIPEGAVPKDGPSAGIAVCTAITSAITKKIINYKVAMTGELTLRGRVLPIGGIKEKLLAANRSGIQTVIMPNENQKDLEEIDDELKKNINFIFAKTYDDVYKNVFI